MSKVSIGLRGWRFEESDVFTDDGEFRPLDDLPTDVRQRLVRLGVLAGSPCDACWLIHGDEDVEECNVAAVVYGEPLAEVVLCSDHEADFVYWFREEGGEEYAGDEELQDAFHEWFVDGGRAPQGYGGVDHVTTDPSDLPDPPVPDEEEIAESVETGDRIDLRNVDL